MKRTSRRMRQKRQGFTLFEVLLVLIILIILTSTVSYYVIGAQKKAYARAAKAQIGLFKSPLTDYHIDVGGYPSTDQGLDALRTAPDGNSKWAGPYIENAIPRDPWGNPYQYQSSGSAYLIWSFGPDGQDGSGDEITSEQ